MGDGVYLTIAGHDAQVDRNEFRNKGALGNMIDVRGSGSQIAQRVWIHHNYFHDFTSPGGNGAETIRFGLSGLSLSSGFSLIVLDLDGQPRLGPKDKGADEYSTDPVIAEFLTPGAILRLIHGGGQK